MSHTLPSAAAHLERLFDENAPANVRYDSLTVLLSNQVDIAAEARAQKLRFRDLPNVQELAYCPAELASIIAFTVDPETIETALNQRTDLDRLKVALGVVPHLADSSHISMRRMSGAIASLLEEDSNIEASARTAIACLAQEKHALFLGRALKARTVEAREAYSAEKQRDQSVAASPAHSTEEVKKLVSHMWFSQSCLEAILKGVKRGMDERLTDQQNNVDKHLRLWRKWTLGSASDLATKMLQLVEDPTQPHRVKQAATAALEFMLKDYGTPLYLSRPEEELVMFLHQLHRQDVPTHVADNKQTRELGTKSDLAILACALEKSRSILVNN